MAPIDWPKPQKDLICHQLAIITGVFMTYPLTKISLRQMLFGQNVKKVTFYTLHEGLFVLYRGVLPQIFQRCISITGFYIVHQNFNITFKNYPTNKAQIYAGITVGTLDSLLMPFERVQVILADKTYNQTYKNTWHCFHTLVTQHGFHELYRGFEIVYLRNLIGGIIFFSLLFPKEKLLGQAKNEAPVITKATRICIDSLQGTMISMLIHPLNVLRVFLHKNIGERYMHSHIAVKHVYKENGVFFFFSGLYVNLFRSWMSWVIIAVTNEMYKQYFANYIKPKQKE